MIRGRGIDVAVDPARMTIAYGAGVSGPALELRRLDAIRASLLDPACDGPDPVYGVAMDVARDEDREELRRRNLLFGVMLFAAGRLGEEPVRSQGHVHKNATPEIYEVWAGRATVLMQERAEGDPGRCFAAEAGPGEHVVVPPGWAHATISSDPREPLVFGACCERDYGFVYDGVRRHGGLAWFPRVDGEGRIGWSPNPRYRARELERRAPVDPAALGLRAGEPMYGRIFPWVSEPGTIESFWKEI
jgi:glucose-6-phosphate isomerase